MERGSPFLEGHFPGRPLLPAVAQFWMLERLLEVRDSSTRTTALRSVRFLRPIEPGAHLTITLDVDESAHAARFEIRDSDGLISKGKIEWQTTT